jgi:hypothetical protein
MSAQLGPEDEARFRDHLLRSMNALAHIGQQEAKERAALLPKPSTKPVALRNPYEGLPTARQTNESVDDFLKRVRVYGTDPREVQDSWLWIANFRSEAQSYDEKSFKTEGDLILYKFLENAALAVDQKTVKTSPLLKLEREKLKSDILYAAKNARMVTGKVKLRLQYLMASPNTNIVDVVCSRRRMRQDLEVCLSCCFRESSGYCSKDCYQV